MSGEPVSDTRGLQDSPGGTTLLGRDVTCCRHRGRAASDRGSGLSRVPGQDRTPGLLSAERVKRGCRSERASSAAGLSGVERPLVGWACVIFQPHTQGKGKAQKLARDFPLSPPPHSLGPQNLYLMVRNVHIQSMFPVPGPRVCVLWDPQPSIPTHRSERWRGGSAGAGLGAPAGLHRLPKKVEGGFTVLVNPDPMEPQSTETPERSWPLRL